MDIEKRFFAKVEKTRTCWMWTASKADGYGRFWIGSRKDGYMALAHRISFELSKGPIPDGKTLDHICRNRGCVNPMHLEVVDPVENVMRGISDPALNAKKTHCPRGHEYTPENTYIQQPQGWRHCKTCYAIRRNLRQE